MEALLADALQAHGGLGNWRELTTLTARLSLGGPFWATRGWPGVYDGVTVTLDTRWERIVFDPFTTGDRRSVLEVGPDHSDRIAIETNTGDEIAQRTNPLASYPPFTLTTPWDALQVAYFTSYAVWNYLTTPFLLASPGVRTREIDPWRENGETWRRLAVTFPPSIATHNGQQTFYFDDANLLRRLDYQPVVTGAPIAHYTDQHQAFDGFVFPTHRRVFRRKPDNTADQQLAVITLDIKEIAAR